MSGPRFVVVGLARAHSGWFRDLGRWSTTGAIPCDFVKCVSPDELRTRLDSGRAYSAVIIDGSLPALDRDLVDRARQTGCPVIAVDDGRARNRDWALLGISAVLTEPLTRDGLVTMLNEHCRAVDELDTTVLNDPATGRPGGWRGQMVAVTGAGGTGTSMTAMAVAQGFGADARYAGQVLLADMSLDADQAMLHDTGDVVPGLQELVEAFRAGAPEPETIRAMCNHPEGRGYLLLSGLRRHRDWVSLRPRAFEAALDALRRVFQVVVADVDPDMEGVDDCGSMEVEERNLASRSIIPRADVVVVTAVAGTAGIHKAVRVMDEPVRHHVPSERILPVLSHAPRSPHLRAELTRALAELTAANDGTHTAASPVFVSERRHTERDARDARRAPRSTVQTVLPAIEAVLAVVGPRASAPVPEPVAVKPGSVGTWHG